MPYNPTSKSDSSVSDGYAIHMEKKREYERQRAMASGLNSNLSGYANMHSGHFSDPYHNNVENRIVNTHTEEKVIKCSRCGDTIRVHFAMPDVDMWENNRLQTENFKLKDLVRSLESKIDKLKTKDNKRSVPTVIASVTEESKKLIIKKRNK